MPDIVFQNKTCKLKRVGGPHGKVYLVSTGRVDMSSPELEDLGVTEKPDLRPTEEYLCLDSINIIAIRGYYDDTIYGGFVTQIEFTPKQTENIIMIKLGSKLNDIFEALDYFQDLRSHAPLQIP